MANIQIKDATILVTGANRGIGRAYVEAGLELGAKKIYACSRDIGKLADLVSADPQRVTALELDVTDKKQIENAAMAAGDVTLVVNNAGLSAYSGFTVNHNLQGAQKEMDVNYFGMLNMSIAFAPVLKQNGGGALVNIISVGGLSNFPFAATYCASKAAAHSLTQGLRAELSGQGTFVAGVYPGPVDTDMAAGVDMEKETPGQVALSTYKALEEGIETIFPDKFAVDFAKTV